MIVWFIVFIYSIDFCRLYSFLYRSFWSILQSTVFYLLYFQNYFGDPWNTLDFIIVIGSIIDILLGKLMVSASAISCI